MKEILTRLNDIDRRAFLTASAKAAFGVGLMPALQSAVAAVSEAGGGKAKRIIYLFMAGAMSHLDTFDLKPGHKNQGATTPIDTNVPGMQVSRFLPMLSRHFDNSRSFVP